MEQIIQLALELIVATVQVRTEFVEESLHGLKETLLAVGQMAPIRVRKEGDLYVIVDGERRYRAAKMAGWKTIAAIVEEQELTPAAVRHRQLVANCQRDSLTPMETATAIAELMHETGWTASVAATNLGMSNATVSRLLALVKLPEAIQAQVRSGEIPASAAYELSKIEDLAEQEELAAQIVGGLTRDGLSEIVKRKGNGGTEAGTQPLARIKAELSDGRSITVAGVGLTSLDVLIEWLLELAAKAKKLRPKGLDLTAFAKLLRDEAKA